MRLPTSAEFDAVYDGTLDAMTAFRNSGLYDLVKKAVTSESGVDGPMPRFEVSDEDVQLFADELAKQDEAAGRPMAKREFPVLKAALQKLIEYLVGQLIGGGFGGLFPTPE